MIVFQIDVNSGIIRPAERDTPVLVDGNRVPLRLSVKRMKASDTNKIVHLARGMERIEENFNSFDKIRTKATTIPFFPKQSQRLATEGTNHFLHRELATPSHPRGKLDCAIYNCIRLGVSNLGRALQALYS